MARIRSIKPEFWVSEQIAECSSNARLTFVGMWNFCDDQGVHPAKPKTLKAELYPMDDITAAQVGEWVAELVKVGLVREFEAPEDGERYWHVTGWDRHQKIDRPSYKHPAPPAQDSPSTRRASSTSARRMNVGDDSSKARRAPPPGVDRSGVDRSGVEGDSPQARQPAPTTQPKKAKKQPMPAEFSISPRVQAWAAEKGYDRLPEHFESFKGKCAANGYSYADWDAAFMGAVRDDWAKLRDGRQQHTGARRALLDCEEVLR
ncbi:MAG: hypothetical protein KBC73_13185 [Burkholderiaceae bacterium]|nr:hypothetical protein [Burkholderiaceae bacterium]